MALTQNGGTGPCYYCGGERLGCGTVFELSPERERRMDLQHDLSVQGGIDGACPTALTIDGQGNLYGATQVDCTAVSELSREPDGTWILSNAYDFTGTSDGESPGSVVVDSSGNVYGTTLYSYSGNGPGTVFELQLVESQWIEKTSCTHARIFPASGLVMDSKGDLYGTDSMTLGPMSAYVYDCITRRRRAG